VEQLGGAFGESGLLVLPCVAAHLNQVFRLFVHLHIVLGKLYLTSLNVYHICNYFPKL
jgi:hypothetical protein